MPEHSQTSDNILIEVYDAAVAPTYEAVRGTSPVPKRRYKTHNVTRASYHEAIIGALNGTVPDLTVDALALGNSTTDVSTIPDGQALGNETFRTGITDTFISGQTFSASIFIDSTEGNTLTFEEAALVSEQPGGDLPINRFLISDASGLLSPKSAEETITIDIELTQQDA